MDCFYFIVVEWWGGGFVVLSLAAGDAVPRGMGSIGVVGVGGLGAKE